MFFSFSNPDLYSNLVNLQHMVGSFYVPGPASEMHRNRQREIDRAFGKLLRRDTALSHRIMEKPNYNRANINLVNMRDTPH
jgi:hypothetical protein